MTRRTNLTLMLLVAAAATLALASPGMLRPSPSSERADAPSSESAPRSFRESAIERRRRLLPSLPSDLTQMRAPIGGLQVEQMPLRQTRHDGHVGLYRDRPDGYRPVSIVVHATGNGTPGSEFPSLEALGLFFQRQGVAASHYGVDRDGRVMQYVDDSQAAFHVSRPGWNGISLGIELLNDNSGSQPFPPAQLQAARRLVQLLGDRYGIPVEAVVAHRTIQPEDRSDPARNFPWDSFINSLRPMSAADSVGQPRRSDVGRDRLDLGQAERVGGQRAARVADL